MSDHFMKAFGANVAVLRKAAGLNQDDLANRVGLSRTSITNIEQGRNAVTMSKVPRLAVALRVPIAELFPECLMHDEVGRQAEILRAELAVLESFIDE